MEENELFHDIQFLLGVCFNLDNSHTLYLKESRILKLWKTENPSKFLRHIKVTKMLGRDFALTVISGCGAGNFCWRSNVKLMIQKSKSDPD